MSMELPPVNNLSSLFKSQSCFQKVQAGVPDYDNLYCAGNTIIMTLTGINTLIFGYLLGQHIKQLWRATPFLKIVTKVKTSILFLLFLYQLACFARYTFNWNGESYDAILVVSQFLQSIILLQICYFYAKKAAHLVEDNATIRRIMRIVIYCALAIFAFLGLWQIFDAKYAISSHQRVLCHTWYFLVATFVNQIANGFFVFIGYRISQSVIQYNSHAHALIAHDSVDEMVAATLKEIGFRKRAVRNMWIMIVTIFIVDTYSTLYSLILFTWGDEKDCYVQDTVWVKSLSTTFERSLHYIWWVYPIICLFWPHECSRAPKNRSMDTSQRSDLTRHSINSHIQDTKDIDDDDEECDFQKPENTYLKVEQLPGGAQPTEFVLNNRHDGRSISKNLMSNHLSTSSNVMDGSIMSQNRNTSSVFSHYAKDGQGRPHSTLSVSSDRRAQSKEYPDLANEGIRTPTSDNSANSDLWGTKF